MTRGTLGGARAVASSRGAPARWGRALERRTLDLLEVEPAKVPARLVFTF